MAAVREPFEHASRIEVPYRCARHHVHAQWAEDAEVEGCVVLLHESVLLVAGSDAVAESQRADEALHQELAREGKHNDVEGDEGEIEAAFAVVCPRSDGMVGAERVIGRERVGKENGVVQRVAIIRRDEVEADDNQHDDQRVDPCMSKGEFFPSSEVGAGFPPFGRSRKRF